MTAGYDSNVPRGTPFGSLRLDVRVSIMVDF